MFGANWYQNMNNNNNFYNFNNAFNFNCPLKVIKNQYIINGIYEPSSINSVLQAFGSLTYLNVWLKFLESNTQQIIFGNKIIAKEFYNLFSTLYTGQIPDSSSLINNYINKYKTIYKGNIKQDPYHFLFYLLDFLHMETNSPNNPNYNANILSTQSLNNKKNSSFMYNLFSDFLKQTQNSIVSNYFYNILGYKLYCPCCNTTTYFYQYKFIIKFNLDDFLKYRNQGYPYKSNTNLTLDDCFDCYTGNYNIQCTTDGCFNAKLCCSFVSSPKVLIIALIRSLHTYKNDLNFGESININNYFQSGQNNFNNVYYNLKACVGLNNFGKYFTDVKMNNTWYRFYGNQSSMINSNNIYIYEPQILIYELNEMNFKNFGWGFC